MAGNPLGRVVDRFRVLARMDDLQARPDADLLRLFARDRDEAAFELLVRRHGRAVMGVCGRLLSDRVDAEDAYQATFLVLARRARALRDPAAVGCWLHGVARRVALEARALAARRRAREASWPTDAPPEPAAPPARSPESNELAAVLDAEVAALPERYRAAIVLCDLGGKTRAEAATALGVPEGTVASRQARGRALLVARLRRRGVTLAALALLPATVPPALAASTARIAALVAAGRLRHLPPALTLLTHGARPAMTTTLLKPVVVAVAGAALAVCGLALAGRPAGVGEDPPAPPPSTARPARTPAEEWAALKAEYDADRKANTKAQIDKRTGQPIPGAFEVRQPGHQKYADRLLALGRCDDEATAAEALALAVTGWFQLPLADQAFDLLLERFADSPRLAGFARQHHAVSYPGKYRRLERLLGVATDRTVREISLLDLGLEMEPGYAPTEMPAGPAADEKRRAKAAALYRRVIAEYPDVVGGSLGNGCHLGKLGRVAQTYLLRLEPKCRDGLPAPPTVGKDLDGKPMALAGFKGRIVVLDFWGSWCQPCREAMPALKDLAAKYADRGVVVLGVASENAAADAARVAAAEKLPWRSWFDRRDENGDSPIVSAWGVTTFPTVAVVDGEGLIRFLKGGANAEEVAKSLDVLLAKPGPPAPAGGRPANPANTSPSGPPG